jgi:hypothetical protein
MEYCSPKQMPRIKLHSRQLVDKLIEKLCTSKSIHRIQMGSPEITGKTTCNMHSLQAKIKFNKVWN